jgi:hypothetical protein
VITVKSMIVGTAVEICRASGASMDVPREVTGPSAITIPTALIKPNPPSQTRMEPIRRANAARGFMLYPQRRNLALARSCQLIGRGLSLNHSNAL